ncbi:MAG: hypothetical protein SOV57_06125 [Bacilli bacterium]|nr:hypothetical protein [Erysipelotrichaceae bacterium]MDD6249575.1 hypothetical protein [Bacillales bacterium]MDY2746758.1 hypothetical protein [Bacilli bacterium]MDD7382193.1 hypothetical protein [Bacillales bacterium]MDY3890167.1 hypothetical protein [Bacilli bacterium]
MSNQKKNNIDKRKSTLTKRFVVLFVVFTMGVIWIFSILANNNVLQKGTPRIITLVCLIAVSVIYWTVFYILLRRQDQRKDN